MSGATTKKDLRDVLELVGVLHADGPGGELPTPALAHLARMVGCDSASYCRVDHASRRVLSAVITPACDELSGSAAFAAVLDQHPAFTAHRNRQLRSGTSVALTDLVDGAALRDLPIYADFYRPRQMCDQLLSLVTIGRRQGSVLVFNRSRHGFSTRTRELLDLASPLICQAIAQRARLATLTTALRDAQRHGAATTQAADRLAAPTPREREVAACLADGLGDRDIARALDISPRTVQKHLEQMYRKLGLTSRAALVAAMRTPTPSTPSTATGAPLAPGGTPPTLAGRDTDRLASDAA
ncbi:helix-turn-helix transcriptional regulator [Candidatus Frankia nodulisporulans]|uniref:helix-turn-helix transcriptional regulator n=1 Tax=Candidatus Frankia nodulisporulans TaxID=2060052 RepID=UPI0013D5F8AF|nr:helix-turn-helix transcriptional regulator [Candidatus Frankia nodulisporulans]